MNPPVRDLHSHIRFLLRWRRYGDGRFIEEPSPGTFAFKPGNITVVAGEPGSRIRDLMDWGELELAAAAIVDEYGRLVCGGEGPDS